ncbi:hypothetical protein OAS39_04545 [Pirellulales bacterium]|nr:hypothetical protein [Pirellulales bacterium]
MNRVPPLDVRMLLRKEVGYLCGRCQSCPFLTWHHFAPPWRVEQHHRPEGIIALCRKCHDIADAGTWTSEQLVALKRTRRDREQIRVSFPWMIDNCLIRLGGGVYASNAIVFEDSNKRVVLGIGENEDGVRSITMRMENTENEPVAEIVNSEFSAGIPAAHDVEVSASAHKIKVWMKERNVGLELVFRRFAIESFEKLMRKDEGDFFLTRGFSTADYSELGRLRSVEDLDMFSQRKGLSLASCATRWNALAVRDTDGNIPILDFKNADLRAYGTHLLMRDGLLDGLWGQMRNCFVQSDVPLVLRNVREIASANQRQLALTKGKARVRELATRFRDEKTTPQEQQAIEGEIESELAELGWPVKVINGMLHSLRGGDGQGFSQGLGRQ